MAVLAEQDHARVPGLVPIRYGRMLASAFTFFRGAAAVMAADLATTPASGLTAQICGDAHCSNFGLYASPERRLVFDVNDFDETTRGPWEWDVKRLCASLAIAGRNNGHGAGRRRACVVAAAQEYRMAMARFADMSSLGVWYASLGVEVLMRELRTQFDPKRVKAVERTVAKTRARGHEQAMAKLTTIDGNGPSIVSDPPLIVPIEELVGEGMDVDALWSQIVGVIGEYRNTLASDRRALLDRYRPVHMARKVVGVGSVGTRAWIVLLLGRDDADPLFLQAKEAGASVLERFVGKSPYANHGERVVAGQRLMQASSDIFLGWDRVTSPEDGVRRDFYVRQLRDMKGSAEIDGMEPDGLAAYGRICGWTLARAHARSGDPIAIAAYLGRKDAFDRAIASFAEAYADQNERDYERLVEAERSGAVKATRDL